MRKVDYIVVGLGIAGVCICEELHKQGKSFIAIDNGQQGATAKSGGVLNPTVLKRFNAAWNVAQFYPAAISFYKTLSLKLKIEIFHETPILRIFKSIEEQNNWSVASDKRELQHFLSSKFVQNENPHINASLGFGKVLGTAKIDAISLLGSYKIYLKKRNELLLEHFEYDKLEIEKNGVVYNSISANKIIFCEGVGVLQNPFFPSGGIIPNKGEYLLIKAPELKLQVFLKGPLYIIPLGKSLYKIGATFDQDNFSIENTVKAREEILLKLKTMINCPFEVVNQTVGIRPTTKDRKPLIGSSRENPRIAFFNGLGSRGFTMAPLLSEILYKNVAMNESIPQEMDIHRIDVHSK